MRTRCPQPPGRTTATAGLRDPGLSELPAEPGEMQIRPLPVEGCGQAWGCALAVPRLSSRLSPDPEIHGGQGATPPRQVGWRVREGPCWGPRHRGPSGPALGGGSAGGCSRAGCQAEVEVIPRACSGPDRCWRLPTHTLNLAGPTFQKEPVLLLAQQPKARPLHVPTCPSGAESGAFPPGPAQPGSLSSRERRRVSPQARDPGQGRARKARGRGTEAPNKGGLQSPEDSRNESRQGDLGAGWGWGSLRERPWGTAGPSWEPRWTRRTSHRGSGQTPTEWTEADRAAGLGPGTVA